APVVTVTGPTFEQGRGTATFQLAASEPASFFCLLDGAPVFLECSSPQTYHWLGAGAHTLVVMGIDPTRNFSAWVRKTWVQSAAATSPSDTSLSPDPGYDVFGARTSPLGGEPGP